MESPPYHPQRTTRLTSRPHAVMIQINEIGSFLHFFSFKSLWFIQIFILQKSFKLHLRVVRNRSTSEISLSRFKIIFSAKSAKFFGGTLHVIFVLEFLCRRSLRYFEMSLRANWINSVTNYSCKANRTLPYFSFLALSLVSSRTLVIYRSIPNHFELNLFKIFKLTGHCHNDWEAALDGVAHWLAGHGASPHHLHRYLRLGRLHSSRLRRAALSRVGRCVGLVHDSHQHRFRAHRCRQETVVRCGRISLWGKVRCDTFLASKL